MAVKLHRCPLTFLNSSGHGCANVQRALEEQGIEYELVKAPLLPRGRRKEVKRLTGQTMVPVIEFPDGTGYRAESGEMVERIRSGNFGDTA